jgi:hypothetical protein
MTITLQGFDEQLGILEEKLNILTERINKIEATEISVDEMAKTILELNSRLKKLEYLQSWRSDEKF